MTLLSPVDKQGLLLKIPLFYNAGMDEPAYRQAGLRIHEVLMLE